LAYIEDVFPQALAALLFAGLVVQGGGAPLLVSAAISLTDALTEVAAAYRSAGGGDVRFNFAGSNVLARQIVNGAPADLFISADSAQMAVAVSSGAVDRPVPLLRNRLAVVTPAGGAANVPDLNALLRLRRIAVGDPAAVPAGVYARQYLERRGLWSVIEPKLLPLANVRAALNAVESGGADAGIVYESDAAALRRVDLAFVVDSLDAPSIVYPAAVVSQSRNKAAAARFLRFLQGPEAASIFLKYRFRPAATSGTQPPRAAAGAAR
jgi:molybdate transport system substrate-binding protein